MREKWSKNDVEVAVQFKLPVQRAVLLNLIGFCLAPGLLLVLCHHVFQLLQLQTLLVQLAGLDVIGLLLLSLRGTGPADTQLVHRLVVRVGPFWGRESVKNRIKRPLPISQKPPGSRIGCMSPLHGHIEKTLGLHRARCASQKKKPPSKTPEKLSGLPGKMTQNVPLEVAR